MNSESESQVSSGEAESIGPSGHITCNSSVIVKQETSENAHDNIEIKPNYIRNTDFTLGCGVSEGSGTPSKAIGCGYCHSRGIKCEYIEVDVNLSPHDYKAEADKSELIKHTYHLIEQKDIKREHEDLSFGLTEVAMQPNEGNSCKMVIKSGFGIEDNKYELNTYDTGKDAFILKHDVSGGSEMPSEIIVQSRCLIKLEEMKQEPQDMIFGPEEIHTGSEEDNECKMKIEDISFIFGGADDKYTTEEGENLNVRKQKANFYQRDGITGLYKCRSCVYATKYIANAYRHFKAKHYDNAEVYQCAHCNYATKMKIYLYRHFRHNHDKSKVYRQYRCRYCDYIARRKTNLDRHFRCRHDDKSKLYKCTHCSYTAKCKSYLKKHFTAKHDDKAEVYNCTHCAFTTKMKQNLRLHFRCKHDDKAELYNCTFCDYTARRKQALSVHIRCKHDDNAKVYKCTHCNYTSKCKQNLNKHFIVKHDDKAEVYKCTRCDYTTKLKSVLNLHFTLKHDDEAKVYTCTVCDFTTRRKTYLNVHFRVKHHGKVQVHTL